MFRQIGRSIREACRAAEARRPSVNARTSWRELRRVGPASGEPERVGDQPLAAERLALDDPEEGLGPGRHPLDPAGQLDGLGPLREGGAEPGLPGALGEGPGAGKRLAGRRRGLRSSVGEGSTSA